jgi:hypothetical protein
MTDVKKTILNDILIKLAGTVITGLLIIVSYFLMLLVQDLRNLNSSVSSLQTQIEGYKNGSALKDVYLQNSIDKVTGRVRTVEDKLGIKSYEP